MGKLEGKVPLQLLGFCALGGADLLCSEPASTNAATPDWRHRLHASWHLLIGAPGSHQFATALRTLSLTHRSDANTFSSRSRGLVARVNRTIFLNRESGRVTKAVPLQAGCVITLVLGVRQSFNLQSS